MEYKNLLLLQEKAEELIENEVDLTEVETINPFSDYDFESLVYTMAEKIEDYEELSSEEYAEVYGVDNEIEITEEEFVKQYVNYIKTVLTTI